MDAAALALLDLGRILQRVGYRFTAVTPETHRRVNARAAAAGAGIARDLRDVFGWNRPFASELLPRSMHEALVAAELIRQDGGLWRSQVRFATRGDRLFAHSSFPTREPDAVFFGPDSYRFCDLVERWAGRVRRLVDVGCGSGVGGTCAAEQAGELTLADVNTRALRMAAVNAALNGVTARIVQSDVLAAVEGPIDCVIANPPYMRDAAQRVYRDGGGDHGEALSLRIVSEALERLTPEGVLILYTGSAIVAGRDGFFEAVRPLLASSGRPYRYEELDPDVFGEELEQPAYAQVERIAVIGLRVGGVVH